jgi:alkylation response protein AidB-like acyl-CoA dehydrogenase
MLKIKGTEIRQAITYLQTKVVGAYAVPHLVDELGYEHSGETLHNDFSATATCQYLEMRKASVYGGSNEIQKNIIAKMILEL